MTNYSTISVIQPELPKKLCSEAEIEFLTMYGFDAFLSENSDKIYFSAKEYQATGYDEEDVEHDEDELDTLLQAIIKSSNGEIPWITIESAFICDKLHPDGFGGSAIFITAHDVRYISTSGWIEQHIAEFETGDGSE